MEIVCIFLATIFDGLVQERRNYIDNALELRLFSLTHWFSHYAEYMRILYSITRFRLMLFVFHTTSFKNNIYFLSHHFFFSKYFIAHLINR